MWNANSSMWKDGEPLQTTVQTLKSNINSMSYMNTEISIFCEVVSEREVQKDENVDIQAEE